MANITLEFWVPPLAPTLSETQSKKKGIRIDSTANDKDWVMRSQRVKVDSVVYSTRKAWSTSLCIPYMLVDLSSQQLGERNSDVPVWDSPLLASFLLLASVTW